jgi:type I restriction enzyme S subunit
VPKLAIFRIEETRILVPPINLQNQFAEKIALIEKQKALAKQELQESEDLFNCLLQKAFKGELV